MKYFDVLPKIVSKNLDGTSTFATNLLARASFLPSVLANPLVYYEYDIQEGDTPEIIAHKYYDDPYRFWIVLMVNKIMDAQWEWPLSTSILENHVASKYPDQNIHSDVHHYEKIETFFNVKEQTSYDITTYLTQTDYNNLQVSEKTLTLPYGNVQLTTSKRAVTLYDYEYGLNESKRTIRLLNANYVRQIESELKELMSN